MVLHGLTPLGTLFCPRRPQPAFVACPACCLLVLPNSKLTHRNLKVNPLLLRIDCSCHEACEPAGNIHPLFWAAVVFHPIMNLLLLGQLD